MKSCMFALAVCMLSFTAAAAWQSGSGIANDRAIGMNERDVTFVQRGAGAGYGWRQYSLPVGLTILPWSIPNFESSVYGLRVNLGWGGYDGTYGIDTGLFSSRKTFGGISANVIGNYAADRSMGFEVGAVNIAGTMCGLQVGVVNFADCLYGVQIGLLNFNRVGITLPILNFGW